VSVNESAYIQDEVVREFEVCQLLVEGAGKHVVCLGGLGQVEDGCGQLRVADANELFEQVVDLGDDGGVCVGRLRVRSGR